MPSRFIRFTISALVVLQLTIVGASVVAHRGTSTIQDDFLTYFDIYRTFGNWRMESNQLALASSSNLSESIWIEWHPTDSQPQEWIAWPEQDQRASLSCQSVRQQRWFRQLADLLGLGITEGASQMVDTATRFRFKGIESVAIDRVRIMVAPTVPIERFEEVESANTIEELPEDLRPQKVYEASLISIGPGQWSLLPKLENRRVAPAIQSQTSTTVEVNGKQNAAQSGKSNP